ncbi:MAG: DUF4783 domain-containing protein [Bacteroidia bacterium]|nr:DUF4783 domain-containing protein [Bacteroidia bacterium]
MKLKLFIICLLIGLKTALAFDINDDIANAIKSGNSKTLASWFTDNVDLKVLDQEDVYSKAQAELIVKDFFTKHPVKTFSIAHKSSKNGSQFAIGTLETTNGKYRVYFLLKKSAEKLQIQQFRIEPENE